jgi:hypothetical protein
MFLSPRRRYLSRRLSICQPEQLPHRYFDVEKKKFSVTVATRTARASRCRGPQPVVALKRF